MKLLWQDNLANLTTNFTVPRGQYGLFLIRYSGVAATGQTVATTDLGNVILNANGNDKINVDVDLLSQLANVYGGAVEASSAAGGNFAFSILIPTGAWFDAKNIYDISANDKVYFKLDYPNLTSAKIVSGTVSVYAKPRHGVMNYWHKILSRAVVSGGAGVITDTLPVANISEVYLKNPAALISQVQLVKDGKVYVDGDVNAELAYSNWIHLLESSVTLLAVEFVESKDVREAISNNLSYKYQFTGAGNLAQYYSAIEFVDANKQAESLANAKSAILSR